MRQPHTLARFRDLPQQLSRPIFRRGLAPGILFLLLFICVSELQAQDVKDLTFDDVKFEMEADDTFRDEMLTDAIRELHGQRIRIRGYIRPGVKNSDIQKFVFVRDNQECCFGPGAMLYDAMLVKMESGGALDFTVRPITIEGTFVIKSFEGPDGKIWAIYRMMDAVKR